MCFIPSNGNTGKSPQQFVYLLQQTVMLMQRVKAAITYVLLVFGTKQQEKEEGSAAVKFHVSANRVCIERWEKEHPPPSLAPSILCLSNEQEVDGGDDLRRWH